MAIANPALPILSETPPPATTRHLSRHLHPRRQSEIDAKRRPEGAKRVERASHAAFVNLKWHPDVLAVIRFENFSINEPKP
jgi:hypothetical protein